MMADKTSCIVLLYSNLSALLSNLERKIMERTRVNVGS